MYLEWFISVVFLPFLRIILLSTAILFYIEFYLFYEKKVLHFFFYTAVIMWTIFIGNFIYSARHLANDKF